MASNVFFPKPSRFGVFKMMYVLEQQRRHHDNSHWQSFSQVCENLGGDNAIFDVWCVFSWAPKSEQKRICGFSDADITAFLDKDNAGELYAEAIR